MEQAGGAGELLNALGLWKEAVGGGAPWATSETDSWFSFARLHAARRGHFSFTVLHVTSRCGLGFP